MMMMMQEEYAFDRFEPPYRPIAGRRATSCHDDIMAVVSLVDELKIVAFYVNLGCTSDVSC